ncbi:hypothetical protein [Rhodococcus sp. USK13]|uniref:hypothetical protein n=1 Tax=Rhodococcus sp. USK13 TaxID=2806442 RepID=UPI001BCBDDE9|nr:hypothetical protein [Rhodococcus sp. USK13]
MATTTAAGWRPTLPDNPVRATAAGKIAALLALACVTAHIPVLLAHFAHFPGTSLLMLALAGACLPCAGHLWTKPTIRDWVTAGALAAGMLVLHAMLMFSMTHAETGTAATTTAATGHHHGSAAHTMNTASLPDGPLGLLFYGASALALVQVAMAVVIVLPGTFRRHRTTPAE